MITAFVMEKGHRDAAVLNFKTEDVGTLFRSFQKIYGKGCVERVGAGLRWKFKKATVKLQGDGVKIVAGYRSRR